VSSVRRGTELSLRSLVGGPQRIGQRDRMFSLSVRRLDIVIGRLLPDGARPDGGGRHLQALGGMGILPRDLREAGEALFPGGPVGPGSMPLFPERLLSQFAGQSSPPVFQTADGDEYRWCETTIEVGSAGKAWPLLTRPCQPPPEPPIKDADGYYAYLESLPERFWTRNTPDEVEYAGELQRGRLTNLGTIRRGRTGFTVNANSVRRAADLEAVVLAAASAAGCPVSVTQRRTQTADELTGTPPEAVRQRRTGTGRHRVWWTRDLATPSAVWDCVGYWSIGTDSGGVQFWDGSWSKCHDDHGDCRFCGWYLSQLQLSPSLWQALRLRVRGRQPRRG
jgi:hypothetical protein